MKAEHLGQASSGDWNAPTDERLQPGGKFTEGKYADKPAEQPKEGQATDAEDFWLENIARFEAAWDGKKDSVPVIDYVGNLASAREINARPIRSEQMNARQRRAAAVLAKRAVGTTHTFRTEASRRHRKSA